MRRQLPMALVFVGGVFMVFQYFVPHESSEWIYEYLLDWIVVIGIFALAVGIWSLIHVSVDRIKRRRPNWQYSLITLFGLFAMLFFGWTGTAENGDYWVRSKAAGAAPDAEWQREAEPSGLTALTGRFKDDNLVPKSYTAEAPLIVGDVQYYFEPDVSWGFHFYTSEGLNNPMFNLFFEHILIPIQSTMFSLLAFYIASAAYRAFRARNVLSTLLLLAALIVMMRFMPIPIVGEYLSKTSNWIMNVPNLAAQRAIVIGIGLGMVATALKVVLGIERGYMGKG